MIAVVAYGLVTVREAPQRTIETQRVVNGIARNAPHKIVG